MAKIALIVLALVAITAADHVGGHLGFGHHGHHHHGVGKSISVHRHVDKVGHSLLKLLPLYAVKGVTLGVSQGIGLGIVKGAGLGVAAGVHILKGIAKKKHHHHAHHAHLAHAYSHGFYPGVGLGYGWGF